MTAAAFLECALAYAAAGFPVLPLYGIARAAPPDVAEAFRLGRISKKEAMAYARCACSEPSCRSPGKHPLNHDGATGASLDPDQIRAWWSRWPTANIGLRMPPGVAAIDFDIYVPGVPERLRAFQAEQPLTLVQSSGAGGEHWLYHLPADMTPGTSLDGQAGVDIIHHGHRYIVAEPSVHWTGGAYTWAAAPELRAIAKAPPALVARCQRGARLQSAQSASPYAGVRAYRPGETPSPCPPGIDPMDWAAIVARRLPPAVADGEQGGHEHGHVTLARAAAHLIGGLRLAPADAVAVLWEHYNPRCVPPWDADAEGKDGFRDFERTVLAAGRDVTEPGWLLPQPPPAPPPPPTAGAYATLGPPLDFAAEPPPPRWLCEGLGIEAGAKACAIAGSPHSGKGPFSNLLAICVALGLPFLGHAVVPGRVLVLDWETGRRVSQRRFRRMARALGRDPGELTGRVLFHAVSGGMSPERFQDIDRVVVEQQVTLVIVDSYTSAMMGAGVDANTVEYGRFLQDLGAIAQARDIVIMPIMHARKPTIRGRAGATRPTLADVSGTGALGALLQTVIMLWRPDDDRKNEIEVSCARSVEESFRTFMLAWNDIPSPTGQTATSQDPKWGLAAEIIQGEEKVQAPGLKTANDRRHEERVREDAQNEKDVLAKLSKVPFATEKELVDRACAGNRRSFLRVIKRLEAQGLVSTNGEVWMPVGREITAVERFNNQAGR